MVAENLEYNAQVLWIHFMVLYLSFLELGGSSPHLLSLYLFYAKYISLLFTEERASHQFGTT